MAAPPSQIGVKSDNGVKSRFVMTLSRQSRWIAVNEDPLEILAYREVGSKKNSLLCAIVDFRSGAPDADRVFLLNDLQLLAGLGVFRNRCISG
jgi:hypothetical protein